MQYNPKDPQWLNRDRFVLSGGHGSMFLYSWLHIAGYALPMEEVHPILILCPPFRFPSVTLAPTVSPAPRNPLRQCVPKPVTFAQASPRALLLPVLSATCAPGPTPLIRAVSLHPRSHLSLGNSGPHHENHPGTTLLPPFDPFDRRGLYPRGTGNHPPLCGVNP